MSNSDGSDGFQFPRWAKRLWFFYVWHFPLSPLRIGYQKTEHETQERIELKERRLSIRLSLFLLFTFIRSFLLAMAFTWPLTLSPLIDALAELIPDSLWRIVESIANALQDFLSPIDPWIAFFQDLSKIFNLFNPSFVFVAGWCLVSWIKKEILEEEDPNAVDIDMSLGTNGFIQEFGRKSFGISHTLSPWFVLIFMQVITFLFLIRGAKSLVYELQSDKQCEKREKNIKNTLIGEVADQVDIIRSGRRWGNQKRWRFLPEILVTLSQMSLFLIPVLLLLCGILPSIT